MKEYYEILKEINDKKIDITKLYIYSCISTEIEEQEHERIVEYIYDSWLEIDADVCLARLCEIVSEHWEEIKEDEFMQEDIEFELFS